MKLSLKTKLKIIIDAKLYVFRRPAYWLIFFLSAFFIMGFIVWSLNLDLLKYILFDSPLTIWGKIEFFLNGYGSLLSSFESIQAVAIVIFSLLFGVNVSMLIYSARFLSSADNKEQKTGKKQKIPKKSGAVALGSAVVGGGCIACGTSLLAPIFTTLGITSIGLVRNIGTIFLTLGSILTLYSIYKLSIIIVNIKARS
ncbi:hypothetical protein KC946_01075 [Candidatus Saccharibacteria bacterium]|nr:hypothetical protein [Candidatus Saccharibacteria bacterium]